MILHDFSLYTSLHLPGETRVTSVTYSTLIDFMLHVVTQNALFSLCIKKIPRNSLSRFITNTSPVRPRRPTIFSRGRNWTLPNVKYLYH